MTKYRTEHYFRSISFLDLLLKHYILEAQTMTLTIVKNLVLPRPPLADRLSHTSHTRNCPPAMVPYQSGYIPCQPGYRLHSESWRSPCETCLLWNRTRGLASKAYILMVSLAVSCWFVMLSKYMGSHFNSTRDCLMPPSTVSMKSQGSGQTAQMWLSVYS